MQLSLMWILLPAPIYEGVEGEDYQFHVERTYGRCSVVAPVRLLSAHRPEGHMSFSHIAYVTNFTVLDVIGTLWLINN